MLDTLVEAGAYATLSPRRAHLLPKIGLSTVHPRYAVSDAIWCLEKSQTVPLPEQSTSVLGQKAPFWRSAGHFRSTSI